MKLLERAKKVIAIELDPRMVSKGSHITSTQQQQRWQHPLEQQQ
jgi:16S rRNA A1518/A1519 N6-dimethyltransferase RsmA/KsgA/DIM1 with predicted DNA glycosylase/AP lyase activity